MHMQKLNQAQRQLFRFVRNRMNKPLIAVVDDQSESPWTQLLKRQFHTSMSDQRPQQHVDSEEVLWQIVSAPAAARAVVAKIASGYPDRTLSLLEPDVVIATANIKNSEVLRIIGLAAPDSLLVLESFQNDTQALRDKLFDLPDAWELLSVEIPSNQHQPNQTTIERVMAAIQAQMDRRQPKTHAQKIA